MPATALPLDAQLAAASADADALVAGLDDEAGRWRPGPGRWSVAECLAHLAVTTRLYLPALERGVADARARGATPRGAFHPGPVGRWLIRAMEPVTGRGLRAPPSMAPPADASLADAVRDFADGQRRLRAVAADAATVDLGRARVRSPVFPLVRFPLGTALLMLAAHERRHLAQARRVVETPGFPAGRPAAG